MHYLPTVSPFRRFSDRQQLTRWIVIAACFLLSALVLHNILQNTTSSSELLKHTSFRVLQPSVAVSPGSKKKHDPGNWLVENSNLNHHETGNEWFNDRAKAAIISLVRNEELPGILQSMRQLEYHWNRRYNYPWIFFSEKEFTEEFKVRASSLFSFPL